MSEALQERSDGTDWLGGKVCPMCGKQFAVLYPHLWRYKRPKRGGEHYFCSWGCLRAWDKEGEQKTMGARAILTEADRNEAVRLALAGGDPVEFLRSKGMKDPHNAWYIIKQDVKLKNPDLYEKIPDRRKIRNTQPKKVELPEMPEEPVTEKKVIKAVKKTVRSVNGRKKPPEEEERCDFMLNVPDGFKVTAVDTPVGMFIWYKKQKYLDWIPLMGADNVSMNTEEWKMFLKYFPDVLKILGVDLGE